MARLHNRPKLPFFCPHCGRRWPLGILGERDFRVTCACLARRSEARRLEPDVANAIREQKLEAIRQVLFQRERRRKSFF
jgi:hypothetical protein